MQGVKVIPISVERSAPGILFRYMKHPVEQVPDHRVEEIASYLIGCARADRKTGLSLFFRHHFSSKGLDWTFQ